MTHVVTAKLYDLMSNELADISAICYQRTLKRRLNQARIFTIQAPAGHSLLTSIADDGDGYPNLRAGNRKLIVWEDDDVIFHGRVFTIERSGDANEILVTITAFDPWMELGYDSNNQAGRPVRGSSGNLISPRFTSSVVDGGLEVSGPDLVWQVLTNSQNSDPTLGEGPLPIDLTTGEFDYDIPPAIDLSVAAYMDWPVQVGDFITQLIQTGVFDVDMRPLDPAEDIAVANPYLMVALSAINSLGTDKSGTVHFDYFTGSKNAVACSHSQDFTTMCNKLYYYLGPRLENSNRWASNIAPDSPGVIPDVTASRALYGGDPDNPGQFAQLETYDSNQTESANRAIYMALFNAELGLRLEPRQLLNITPASDDHGLFSAPADFDVGDLIAVNVGADFGLPLAEAQRVYGYDKTWDRQNVARLGQIITSADAE